MPNRIQALLDFLDDDGLLIPMVKSKTYPAGKDYLIPSPDAATGLRLQGFAEFGSKIAAAQKARDEGDENADPGFTAEDVERLQSAGRDTDFQHDVLGDAYDQMVADGVSWVRLQRITEVAYATFVFGEDQANEFLAKRVAEGKASAPTNRAARRGGSKTTTSTRRARTGNAGTSR